MNKESIKNELIKRVKDLPPTSDKASGGSSLVENLNQLSNRIRSTEPFPQEIVDTLNKILEEQKLNLSKTEESELIEYLKPTIIDLVKANFLSKLH